MLCLVGWGIRNWCGDHLRFNCIILLHLPVTALVHRHSRLYASRRHSDDRPEGRHQHLVGCQRTVSSDQGYGDDLGRIDEPHPVPRHERYVAEP